MSVLLSWITRKLVDSQSRKRRWVRRAVLLVALVRWFDRRTARTQVVRLRRGQHAEVTVVDDAGGTR